ncbi:MAG: type II toxin-antitoxin system RelB/DinJ family antitoxin [Chlorobium sp.]
MISGRAGLLFACKQSVREHRHEITTSRDKQEKEMIANTVVRARIDEKTKAEATAVLASIGLTLSDAVRLMLMRVAAEKALPFEPLTSRMPRR